MHESYRKTSVPGNVHGSGGSHDARTGGSWPMERINLPKRLTDKEYFLYANVDVADHRFHPEYAVPWLTKVFKTK